MDRSATVARAPPDRPVDSPGNVEAIRISPRTSILAVDLEEWADGSCSDDALFLIDLFASKQVRATFFVLGSVACREPHLVRRLAAAGHEIASHGWNHEQVFRKTPQAFRNEMTRSFEMLSSLVGKRIAGYRAPHFSIRPGTYWAFDVLADVGFAYDSSVFPIAGPRYGIPRFPRSPVRISRSGRQIVEVPLSTVRVMARNLPVAGGGYFRLLPYDVIEGCVRAVHADGLPFVSYCHPYEFRREALVYPSTPGWLGAARAALLGAKFNFCRQTMRGKLARLLDGFSFTSFERALGSEVTH